MMSSKNIILAVVVILGAAFWWFTKSQQSIPSIPTTTPTVEQSPTTSPATTSSTAIKNTVNITSSSFEPANITIKVADTVTWKNTDSSVHTVNSDVHPTHLLYPPLNLGSIQPGASKSLTFSKAGKYTYHDHLNPSLTGSVTVE